MATPKLNLTTTNAGGDGKSFLGWRQEIDNPTSSNMTKIDDFAIEAAASTLVLKNKTNFAGTNGDLLMISTGSGVTSGSGLADIAGSTLPYVTFSTTGDLTAERVLNVSNGLLISTATSGKVFITPNIISGSGVLVKTTAATSAIQLSANITTGSNVEFSVNSGSAVKVNAKMKGGVSLSLGDGLNPVGADSSTIVRTPYALKCVTYRALSMDGAVPTPGDCYYILSYWTGSAWTSSISGNFLSSEDHGGSFVDSFAAGTYLKFHCVSNAANLTSIHLTLTYAEDW